MECLTIYSFLDPSRVCIFGGSHGGFLALHLAGQFSDAYAAVAVRNPVTNAANKTQSSDLPDAWNVDPKRSFNYKSPGQY